jgi:hypothetical protein
MFKRMSVLVRRPDHDRPTFSALWEQHAAPVSGLPRVRGYVQNHIEEEFGGSSPIGADGFVELLWDRPEDMADAFASDAARPMVEDEPGFLGHGSGYALAASELNYRPDEAKLIVAVVGDPKRLELRGLAGLTHIVQDDVTSLIAKPGMAPPQRVDTFLHLWFADIAAARDAGSKLSQIVGQELALGVHRVRGMRFV